MDNFVVDNCVLKRYTGKTEEVIIPEGITHIDDGAFWNCSSVKRVVIPEGVTDIGDVAFRRCSNLVSIEIPHSVTSIGSNAFWETPWLEQQGDFVCVNGILCEYKGHKRNVIVPNTVTRIAGSAFSDCDSIRSIKVPDSVTYIGNAAFSWCNNLKSVVVGIGATSIGTDAFDDCKKLEFLQIPSVPLTAFHTRLKSALIKGFLDNPSIYAPDCKPEYVKYLNSQRKKLLSQAVAMDSIDLFSVYEQLEIKLPSSLCDELIDQATSNQKPTVLGWLQDYKNRTTGQKKGRNKSKE